MLIFTNRDVDAKRADESAFGARFKPGSDRLGFADVGRARKGKAAWTLSGVTASATDSDARAVLEPLFAGSKPVLVHIHGNSMTPADCFERCKRFEELYGVETIGFSWPAEGRTVGGRRVRAALRSGDPGDRWTLANLNAVTVATARGLGVVDRYRQAKKNGAGSTVALARFLALVGAAQQAVGKHQPFSIAAHSLGAYCLQQTVLDTKLRKSLPKARNVALLAACVACDDHAAWIAKLPRSGQVVVTYNIADLVLLGAWYSDGFEVKLGASEPVPPMLPVGASRYADFKRLAGWDHEYFIAETGHRLPKAARTAFTATFSSMDDIPAKANPCKTYNGCCNPEQQVCAVRR